MTYDTGHNDGSRYVSQVSQRCANHGICIHYCSRRNPVDKFGVCKWSEGERAWKPGCARCNDFFNIVAACFKCINDLKDPEPLIDEVAAQLQALPADDRRKTLDAALRGATDRLVEGLAGKDEVRKASLEAIKRLGRKILPALIADLEEGPKSALATLEAGSVVTGIPNDAATSSDLKAKAAAWRAWMEK